MVINDVDVLVIVIGFSSVGHGGESDTTGFTVPIKGFPLQKKVAEDVARTQIPDLVIDTLQINYQNFLK